MGTLDLKQSPYWGFLRGMLNAIDGVAQIEEHETFRWSKFLWSPLYTGFLYVVMDLMFPKDSVWLKLTAASIVEALLKSLNQIHKHSQQAKRLQ